MNSRRLKEMETRFFMKYPDGWDSDELQQILKKHKVGNVIQYAQEVLQESALEKPNQAIENITKLITKSSLVSVFEKVRFKNLIQESDQWFKQDLVDAVQEMLHEDESSGFTRLVNLLAPYKLAKWPILTVILTYYRPDRDVFVKPTTVKRVIEVFALKGLTYTSKVNYDFYQNYRQAFQEMKQLCDPKLSPTNGHFSGFLMMGME